MTSTPSLADLRELFEPYTVDPTTQEWSRLGWWVRRKLRRGQRALNALLAKEPENLDALYLAGSVHRRFDEYPEALACLSAVHAAAPDNRETAWELTWAAIHAGDYRFALSITRSVQIESHPHPNLIYVEGVALLLSGRVSAARQALWKSFESGFNADACGSLVALCDDINKGTAPAPRSLDELLGKTRYKAV